VAIRPRSDDQYLTLLTCDFLEAFTHVKQQRTSFRFIYRQ